MTMPTTASPHALARYRDGQVLCAAKRWPEAIASLEVALDVLPERAAEIHHLLGLSYRGKGDKDAAQRHFATSRALRTD